MTEEKALRYNEGKVDWTLLDFKSCEPLAQAMMYGSNKYARLNWQKPCDDPRQHLQSAMRHLIAVLEGEQYDESLVRHTGHVMANMMMYNYHTMQFAPVLKSPKTIDDRQLNLFGHSMGVTASSHPATTTDVKYRIT